MWVEDILSRQIVQAVGWTLLHFVWQAAAVAGVLAVLLAGLRKATANVHYIIACLALGLTVLLPVVTIQLVPVSAPQPMTNFKPSPAPALVPVQSTQETPLVPVVEYEEPTQPENPDITSRIPWRQRAAAMLEPVLPHIVSGWLLGVFGLSIWHLGGWAQLQRLRRKLTRPVDAALRATLKQLADKLRVGRAVDLLESALVQVPTVVGWLRPVILLPASALTGLTAEQLQALLAHELAHVRRYDYLVNMLQTVVETLGFYHPAVWWVSHRIRVERENCCDDLAVGLCGDRVRYARALTSMEEIRTGRGELAVAASGGNLFAHIRRLLGKDSTDSSRTSWIPSVVTILLIAIIAIPTSLALSINRPDKAGHSDLEAALVKGFCENRDKFKCGVLTWSLNQRNEIVTQGPRTETRGSSQMWWDGKKIATKFAQERTDIDANIVIDERTGGNVYDGGLLSRKPRFEQFENWFEQVIHWTGSRAVDQEIPALRKRRNIALDFSTVVADGTEVLKLVSKNINKAAVDYGAYSVRYFDPSKSNSLTKEEWYTEDNRLRLRFTYKLQDVIPEGWFPVEVETKAFSLKDGQVYMERRLALDLKRCSFNDPSVIPKGIFDFSTAKEHKRLNDIVEKLSKGVVADEADNSVRGPLEFVGTFIAAASAGEDQKAAALIDRRRDGYEQAETLRELLHGQNISLVGLCFGEWNAMVISSVVQADHGRVGPLVFLLKKVVLDQEVHWLIDDIDLETLDTIEGEIKRFIERNPDAKTTTVKPQIPTTNPAPADDNIAPPSAQFILDKMLEHRSRVRNLQYVAEDVIWRDPAAEEALIGEQIKTMREKGISEQQLERVRQSLSQAPESRYQILKCTVDSEEHVKIELTSGIYDSSGNKVPREETHVWAWNGVMATDFSQRSGLPASGIIRDTPQVVTKLGHPWRSFTGIFCGDLEETVEAGSPVSVEELKNGTYRVAFDYKASRYVATVDSSKGYTCSLQETYNKQGQLNSRTTATYEHVAEGIWFPISGQRQEYYSDGSLRHKSTAKSAEIRINNPAFNVSYFDVNIPQGTEVTDEVHGKQYVVGSKRVYDLNERRKPSAEIENIDPNSWQEKFYSIYRLEEGQMLKRIAPPFIPERREYFKLAQPGRYSANTPYDLAKQFVFSWDGDLNIRNIPMGGGIPRLNTTLESVIGLGRNDYDIPPEVLNIDISGDWIVHKDTPQEDLLQALEPIIKDETGRDIDFVKQKVETKAIIARGTYRLAPLPDAKEKNCVHVYTDKLDTDSGAGGGRGTLSTFLRFVGNHRINMIILDNTESGDVELSWRNHYSSDFGWLRDNEQLHNEKVDMLLNNLSRQTGLTFERETAPVEKWFISEKGTINAPPKAAVDNNQVIQKFFELKYYSASDAAQMVRPLLGKTGYLSADQKTNTLVIVDRVENLMRIERTVTELDVPQAGQTTTQLFEIRYGDPLEMVELLKKALSSKTDAGSPTSALTGPTGQPIVLIPEPRRKWIIAKALAEDMKKVQERIEELDRPDATSGGLETRRDDFEVFKPRIIKLENCDPAQMAALLTALFAEDREEGVNIRDAILGENAPAKSDIAGPLSSHFTFQDVPGTSRIIIISNIPKAYDAVEQLVLELDKQKMATKDVKQVRQWMAGLSRFARQAEESEARLMGIGRAMLAYAKDHDGKYPLGAKLYELREYLNTEEYAWTRQHEYLSDGKTTSDRADTVICYDAQLFEQGKGTNILFNDGHVEFIGPERLDELNINKTQILIEMHILEATDGFLKENQLDANSVRTREIRSVYSIAESATEPNSLPYCLILDVPDVNQRFKAKYTPKGQQTKILKAPQALTLEGLPVTMKMMITKLPLPGPSDPNDPSGKAESKLQYAEVGTSIKIVADVLPDSNNVLLDCEWEDSQFRGFEERVGPDGKKQMVPIIARDNIKATATVPDGKILLIGGKKIPRWIVTRTKKPLLGDLPLIGSLFRRVSKVEDTRNVLILIKPTVDPKKAQDQGASGPGLRPLDPNDPLIDELEHELELAAKQR